MSRGRGVAALVLLLVAVAGVLGGIVLERTVLTPRADVAAAGAERAPMRQRMPMRERSFRNRFAEELELTSEQRTVVDSLMDRQLRELRRIHGEERPRVESVIAQTRRAIDSVLTPEQRERAAELVERRRSRRGHRP